MKRWIGGRDLFSLPPYLVDDAALLWAESLQPKRREEWIAEWGPKCDSSCAGWAELEARLPIGERWTPYLLQPILGRMDRVQAAQSVLDHALLSEVDDELVPFFQEWADRITESDPASLRGGWAGWLIGRMEEEESRGVERSEVEALMERLSLWGIQGDLWWKLANLSPHADLQNQILVRGAVAERDWSAASTALEDWEEGGVADTHQLTFHSLSSKVSARFGRVDDALFHLEWMATHGGGEDGLYRKGGFFFALGRTTEAEETYTRYLSRYPKGRRADLVRYHLFRMGMADDESESALAWLLETADPDLAPHRLYWAYRLLGDEASRDELLSQFPTSFHALFVREYDFERFDLWKAIFPDEGEGNLDLEEGMEWVELILPKIALAESKWRLRTGGESVAWRVAHSRLLFRLFEGIKASSVAFSLLTDPERLEMDRESQLGILRLVWPRFWDEELEDATQASGVEPNLLRALIKRESAWQPNARSGAGALGLVQMMPSTGKGVAEGLGEDWGELTTDLQDPAKSLRWGSTYLQGLLDRYEGDIPAALYAYNAGPSRADRWLESFPRDDYQIDADPLRLLTIPIAESRIYVRAIHAHWWVYSWEESVE
ncbi:lytic transglycosylase domain-containing protein [bacterium]|nr:lytic transglycosylase domain-containing protein [bacterium]